MTDANKLSPVMVTGGSGYIAGWIIKLLLEADYSVRTTVRDPTNKNNMGHLGEITGTTSGTLRLFKADLLDQGSFDEAMDGCEVAIHTASPFIISGFKDADEALLRPAKEGTRNVLKSVNRAQSVKRVVLTSSVAAVYGDNCDLRAEARHGNGRCARCREGSSGRVLHAYRQRQTHPLCH